MATIKTNSIGSDDVHTPASELAALITAHLKNTKNVLWLVSGGSAIAVATRARHLIGELPLKGQLHVALVDERYGTPGHKDSNFQQLLESGFAVDGLTMYPALTGKAIELTTRHYSRLLENLANNADIVVGLFGMGKDGHTAGLLPHNPIMEETDYVGSYQGPDYQRISITPAFISQLDSAFLYAVGEQKWAPLSKLSKNIDVHELPVGILKKAGQLIVYSDYKGALS